jgi:hypothetical protein
MNEFLGNGRKEEYLSNELLVVIQILLGAKIQVIFQIFEIQIFEK